MNQEIKKYQAKKVKSYEDLVNLKPQIGEVRTMCIKDMDNQQLNVAAGHLMKRIDKTIGLFEEYSDDKLVGIAELLIEFDPYLKLEELMFIMKEGALGKYGKLYGKFNMTVFGDWAVQYHVEMEKRRYNSHTPKKHQKLIADSVMIDDRFPIEKFKEVKEGMKAERKQYNSIKQWIEETPYYESLDEFKKTRNYKDSYTYLQGKGILAKDYPFEAYEKQCMIDDLNKINKRK